MAENPESSQTKGRGELRPRHSVRLPGFIADQPVGLGDAIKRAISLAGIQPCAGCVQRAHRLNSWLAFTGRQR